MLRSFPGCFLLFILPFTASAQSRQYNMPAAGNGISGRDSAVQLFEQALALMQRNSFKKDTDWDSLATVGRFRLGEANSCRDAYAVINECLVQAQHTHSFVMPQQNASVYNNDTIGLTRRPLLRELMGSMHAAMVDDGIGYITIPWVNTADAVTCTRIADSLQALIGGLAAKGVARWIIDLRKNTGGNCWPMLAGVGPLLGDGICGYFVRESSKTTIRYESGVAMHGNTVMCRTSRAVVLDKAQRQQIVVLTGANTSSAGEIVALAFKGMPDVRLIGSATAGLTTGNATYDLIDGSMLVLTVCKEADRHGKLCDGKVMPDDVVVQEPLKKYNDTVLANAVMWLQSM